MVAFLGENIGQSSFTPYVVKLPKNPAVFALNVRSFCISVDSRIVTPSDLARLTALRLAS